MKKLNRIGVLVLALIVAGLCSTAYAELDQPAKKPGATTSTGYHHPKKHHKKPSTLTGLPSSANVNKTN